MSLSISSISSIVSGAGIQGAGAASSSSSARGTGSAPTSFASTLESAIQSVEQTGQNADTAIQSFLNGDGEELHNVALAVQRANLAFDLGLQVRNKIVSAYQEVMKMQI